MNTEANPWAVLTGGIEPPPWRGDANVHHLSDAVPPNAPEREEEVLRIRCRACKHELPATTEFFYRSKKYASGFLNLCKPCYAEHPSTKRKQERKVQHEAAVSAESIEALHQLGRRCVATILSVLPPWTLIEPGSDKEAFARKVPPCVWWQFPRREWTFPAGRHREGGSTQ